MRKVAVWGFVVIAVGLLFTGAQAQRAAPTPTPTVAPIKPAQQVEVTNFPAVQEVAGTVNVGNTVSGSVEVTNLPVDGDGNVRVAGQATTPAYKFIRILEPTTFPPAQTFAFVGPFDVAGWRRATVFINHPPGEPAGNNTFAQIEYGIDGNFIRVVDLGLTSARGMVTTDVVMPELRVSILTQSGETLEGWLYLSN